MTRKKLIWQIYPPFLVIILMALVSVTWVHSRALNAFYENETRHDLEARTRLVIAQVQDRLAAQDSESLRDLARELGKQSQTRLTFILSSGQVLGDSEEDPARMDNHAERPEVRTALLGRTGVSSRYSHTLRQNMMYVALPVKKSDQVIGCVRASLPVDRMTSTLQGAFYQTVNSGLVIAVVAALLSLWLSRRISQPLEEMKQGAARFARGELDGRLPNYRSEELSGLSDAMNEMASQLNSRIKLEVRQRNEQEAILASMIEGVLAVDNHERILRLNQSAAGLLNIESDTAIGRSVQEVVRKPDLQKFISQALHSQQSIEADITLVIRGKELFLQAHGTPLRDSGSKDIGVLVVLNDLTRLKRLENIRRDFVANVSHELKTPITAIKGSVETLTGGAVEEPESARRFLDIIARQSDRLNAIIEDLLMLSRMEREADSELLKGTEQSIRPILESALQSCATTAGSMDVQLRLFCSEQLTATVNAPLLEQAVINLVDNAIKYSGPKGVVTLEGWQDDRQVKIKIQDRGQGIPKEHLPRIFERFYRVDAARSRAAGGTGLGLAIVKHIVQVHDGEVTVHSTPGEGSVFTILLPVAGGRPRQARRSV